MLNKEASRISVQITNHETRNCEQLLNKIAKYHAKPWGMAQQAMAPRLHELCADHVPSSFQYAPQSSVITACLCSRTPRCVFARDIRGTSSKVRVSLRFMKGRSRHFSRIIGPPSIPTALVWTYGFCRAPTSAMTKFGTTTKATIASRILFRIRYSNLPIGAPWTSDGLSTLVQINPAAELFWPRDS